MMAISVSGIAQRVQPWRAGSVVGSSPIVGAIACNAGDSRFGVAAPAGRALQHRLRVDANEARVVSDEAADERAPGQMGEIVLLDRTDLARRELQLQGDRVDGQAGGLARSAQQRAGARGRRRRAAAGIRADVRVRHSQTPLGRAFVSAESA